MEKRINQIKTQEECQEYFIFHRKKILERCSLSIQNEILMAHEEIKALESKVLDKMKENTTRLNKK